MKARTKSLALPVPLPDRYWQITIEDRGVLTFRHPYYGVASAVVQCLITHREEDRDLSPQATAERMLPMCGLVIGVCWYHPERELDTVLDLAKLGDADLVAYGHRVCEELQDAGWYQQTPITSPHIGSIRSAVACGLRSRSSSR